MVNKILILFGLVLFTINCAPTASEGEPPSSPVLIDSTLHFSLNETGSGIRPDPNSNGIILDWSQNPESKVTDYGLYRTWRTFNGEPFGFDMISKFSNSGVLSFVDTVNVSTDTLYFYKLQAFNAGLKSEFSNIVSYQLIEKPIINSPNIQEVDTTNLEFKWTIVGSNSTFVIKVRERISQKYVWALLTLPENFNSEQSIIYGRKYYVEGSLKQSKEFYPHEKLQRNKEYEWKISLTSSFTVSATGNVIFKSGKGSSSVWTTFKTQ